MKLRKICAVVAISTMALPMAALAESGVFYVNGSAGSINFDEHTNLETDGVYQLGGEYLFTDNFSAELGYGFTEPEDPVTKNKVDVDHIFLNGYYYFGDRSRLQPYVSLGVGHAEFDGDGYDDKDTIASAGIGARLHFTKRFSGRVEARALNAVDAGDVHEQYTVGLSYAFGVKDDKPAPVAAVAAPVAVAAAPLDSDGDGVIDDNDLCPGTPAGVKVNEKGCELLTKERHEERLQVNFPTDSAVVQAADHAEIERVAVFMRKYPEVSTQIEGHTDADGSNDYNLKLSERRADAVRNVLIERFGIEPSRLSSVGYGEAKPIASNSTKEGKAQNRRVIAVLKAEQVKPVQQ